MNRSLTTELTMAVKALPMITPTARSMTLPLNANSLNSFQSFILFSILSVGCHSLAHFPTRIHLLCFIAGNFLCYKYSLTVCRSRENGDLHAPMRFYGTLYFAFVLLIDIRIGVPAVCAGRGYRPGLYAIPLCNGLSATAASPSSSMGKVPAGVGRCEPCRPACPLRRPSTRPGCTAHP